MLSAGWTIDFKRENLQAMLSNGKYDGYCMYTHKVSSLNCHRLSSLVLNAEFSLQYIGVLCRSVLPRESARLTVPKCPGFGPAPNVLIKIESSEVLRSATRSNFCGVDAYASHLSPRKCDKMRRRTLTPTVTFMHCRSSFEQLGPLPSAPQ